jgi:hypothetical protein
MIEPPNDPKIDAAAAAAKGLLSAVPLAGPDGAIATCGAFRAAGEPAYDDVMAIGHGGVSDG